MRTHEWLKAATTQLVQAGIATARLDCLVLLEDATGHDRAWLLSHPEHDLQGSEIKILNTQIAQRAQHIPLAYLRGHAEFYGRTFAVNTHTLVPRPETETMIELARGLAANGKLPAELRILDVGTGSGCIAITAALELSAAGFTAHVSACDIDENCLRAASNLLERAAESGTDQTGDRTGLYDVLLANLPYVPDDFQVNTAATHEPRHALFGGPDGLDLYRTMFAQIVEQNSLESKPLPDTHTVEPPQRPLYVLTESLPPQHDKLAKIAQDAGYRLKQTDDFIQVFASRQLTA
jgi:release factor glutamine methyltransferase